MVRLVVVGTPPPSPSEANPRYDFVESVEGSLSPGFGKYSAIIITIYLSTSTSR